MRTAFAFAVIGLSALSYPAHSAGEGTPVPPGAIQWGPVPPVLPKGGQIAVLWGDPGKSGPLTVRLKLPAGYKIPPHLHPHTEPVTVLSGELWFGFGDRIDVKAAQKLGPGGFVH
ncbi:cupin domain-containing protein, partial [Nostoc sp. NIES-2111]